MDDATSEATEAALAESLEAIAASRVGEALRRLADAFRAEAEEAGHD